MSGMRKSCFVRVLVCLSVLGSCLADLDSRVQTPLSNLPAELRLQAMIPAGSEVQGCGGFWSKTGLVCNKDAAIAYAKKDQAILINEEKAFNSTLDSFFRILNTYTNNPNSDLGYRAKQGSTACWNLIRSIRTNSLCTTCSGENWKYYKGKMMGYGMADCKKYIATCPTLIDSLHFLMTTGVDQLCLLLKSKDSQNTFCESFKSTLSSKLPEISSEFINTISSQSTQEAVEFEKKVVKLCNKVVFIHRELLLFRETKALADFIDGFKNEWEKYVPSKRTSNYKSSESRKLDEALNFEGFHESDITISQQPNSQNMNTSLTLDLDTPNTEAFSVLDQDVWTINPRENGKANSVSAPDGSSLNVLPADLSLALF